MPIAEIILQKNNWTRHKQTKKEAPNQRVALISRYETQQDTQTGGCLRVTKHSKNLHGWMKCYSRPYA